MPRYLVSLTRNASEDAAVILDAVDEEAATVAAKARGDLVWTPGDSASGDSECYGVEEVDAEEPLGVQDDPEPATWRDERALLINALHAAIDAEEENWRRDPEGEPEWLVAARELLDKVCDPIGGDPWPPSSPPMQERCA